MLNIEINKEKSLLDKIFKLVHKFEQIKKNGINSHQKFKYFKLEDIYNEIRRHLYDEKILLIRSHHISEEEEYWVCIRGEEYYIQINNIFRIIDIDSGEEISFTTKSTGTDKDPAKALGKANTYSMRYFLMDLLMLTEEDLDPDSDKGTENTRNEVKGTMANWNDKYNRLIKNSDFKSYLKFKIQEMDFDTTTRELLNEGLMKLLELKSKEELVKNYEWIKKNGAFNNEK